MKRRRHDPLPCPKASGRIIAWLATAVAALGLACGAQAAEGFRTLDLGALGSVTASVPRMVTSGLPQGLLTSDGVPFELGTPIAVTGLDAARLGEFWPAKVAGLPVNQKAARLHLLLGAHHGTRDGIPLANVVLRFKNGDSRTLRLAFGVHTRNVVAEKSTEPELADPNSRLAWQTNAGNQWLRLHQTVFDNPLPDEEIISLEFVSLFSKATPVLFAATVQAEAASALRPVPKSKLWQRATEFPDTAYRREFNWRVTDAAGSVLTNAVATLSVANDARTFFFGQFHADAAGRMVLPYPPQDAVAWHGRVNCPGFAPSSVSFRAHDAAPWPETLEVRLERGRLIGGVVVDGEGQPVAGAEVVPFQITPSGPNQFTRQDFDLVLTGTNGQWIAHASSGAFSNLSFEITHPDFHPGRVEAAPEELLAQRARTALRPHVQLAGRVVDTAGRPVPATVLLYDEDEDTRRTVAADADGRFKFIIPQPADGTARLVAVASNLAPTLLTAPLNRTASALNFTLTRGQPFAMRLADGDGVPLAGINVTLQRWENSQALPWSTVTDAEGRFRWSNAPAGPVTWRFWKTGGMNHTHSMTLPATGEIQFTYNRPIRIAGRVLDAVTQRPVEQFRYRVRYAYGNGSGSTSGTGRHGGFNTSIGGTGKYTEITVMLDASEYEPLTEVLKAPYGLGTNDFLLHKARLIEAEVVTREGKPVPQAEVVLLSKTASAYMDVPGKFRRTSSYYEVVLTDQNGRASLTPRLDADLVLAAHPQLGFAQISTNDFLKNGRIVLEPWGRVDGVLRVGDRIEPEQFVAIHSHYVVYAGPQDRSPPPLYMYYRLEPAADGSFVCDAVPPGERMVQLRYYSPADSGGMRLSHNQPVTVKAGETNHVQIGGTGRTVTGQVVIDGMPGLKLDGRRGVYQLRLQPGPLASEIPPPLVYPPKATPEERLRLRAEHLLKTQEASQNRLRASRFLQRNYLLIFDGDNRFTVPNVPPGNYTLDLTAHDPRAPRNTTRTLGSLTRPVKIPEGEGPFDLGPSTLKPSIRLP